MNIVFLDIDGVLQPLGSQERHFQDLVALRDRLAAERSLDFLGLDRYDIGAVVFDWPEESVSALKRLCRDADAQIVVSSTWRRSKSLQQLRLLFSLHDLDQWVIDVTPMLEGDGRSRADEIQAWLDEHPTVSRFVILDDDYGRLYEAAFPGKSVICSFCLDVHSVETALRILSGQ